MIITEDIRFEQFEPWCGAVDAFNRICDEGDADAVEAYIEDLYPNGIEDTALNDWLWFDPEDLYEAAGLKQCAKCEEWFHVADIEESDDPDDWNEYCETCREEVNREYYESLENEEEEEEEEEENEDED